MRLKYSRGRRQHCTPPLGLTGLEQRFGPSLVQCGEGRRVGVLESPTTNKCPARLANNRHVYDGRMVCSPGLVAVRLRRIKLLWEKGPSGCIATPFLICRPCRRRKRRALWFSLQQEYCSVYALLCGVDPVLVCILFACGLRRQWVASILCYASSDALIFGQIFHEMISVASELKIARQQSYPSA
jgi:hypothetical protein